jgi:Alginate export
MGTLVMPPRQISAWCPLSFSKLRNPSISRLRNELFKVIATFGDYQCAQRMAPELKDSGPPGDAPAMGAESRFATRLRLAHPNNTPARWNGNALPPPARADRDAGERAPSLLDPAGRKHRRRRAGVSLTMWPLALGLALAAMPCAWAQAPALPAGGLRHQSNGLEVVAGLDFNAYYYAMRGTWWGLAASTAPEFDTDRSFAELWLQPRVDASYTVDASLKLRGGLSLGLTQDIGSNTFDYRNEGAARLENAYLGLYTGQKDGWHGELSAGSQAFSLGTGMLVHAGAINGNEWGNAASYKRTAWRMAAIAGIGYRDVTARAFWLDPNEVPSAESGTRIAGMSLDWAHATDGKAGLAYLYVPRSDFVYPGGLAPFVFLQDGRDGLRTWHGWSELTGLFGAVPALTFRGEFAVQRGEVERVTGTRDDLEAHAGYVGASYWFQTLPFAPRLSYGYAYFSGDKPGTATYERFDPLYWGNGLDNWWFGANGAYAFINSNLKFHRVTLDAYLSQQDIVKLQFVRADAAQLNSPIQFGQAVRFAGGTSVPTVGVDFSHLTDEWMLQYVRVFTPSLVFSSYISHSRPGQGFESLAGSASQSWTTLGMGLSYSY